MVKGLPTFKKIMNDVKLASMENKVENHFLLHLGKQTNVFILFIVIFMGLWKLLYEGVNISYFLLMMYPHDLGILSESKI